MAAKRSSRSSRSGRPAKRARSSDTKVESLRIVLEHDGDTTPEQKYGKSEPEYAAEDQRRIESWRRDEWTFIGIYAEVKLIVDGTIQHIRTPGLWGIESDSGKDYFKEVAKDEYDELVGILGKLGVNRNKVPSLRSATWANDY